MKRVLGLDLGTTSIGWALVNQAESDIEKSSIISTGVRVNPLSTDEIGSFEKGKAITTNANRTLKRGARRNLQRYKLRREHLLNILKRENWITDDTILSESGFNSTYQTYSLRAEAAEKEVSLVELAKVLLMINKKRGYKSNRRISGGEEGHLIDGISIARQLYEENITPGQLCLSLINEGKKILPDFYRSDLNMELTKVWNSQKEYYPEFLTEEFQEQLENKSKTAVSKIFYAKYGIYTAENKGKEKRVQAYKWRVAALTERLSIEEVAYVIADLSNEINSSSGYLGAISDRSKELIFNRKTVGQYLFEHIQSDPSFTVRDKVFYRQDYLDEFERIWEIQAKFHPSLTAELKKEIRDVVIFYQRRLKSQKGLISFCEFENRCRVAPRSSIIFQEFKIWQILNNLEIAGPGIDGVRRLSVDEMHILAKELSFREKMPIAEVFECLFGTRRGYSANFKSLEGNHTISAFCKKCLEIVDASGHGEYNADKLTYSKTRDIVSSVFDALGFNTRILEFDSSLTKVDYEKQPLFRLWHLLYSYEGDNSATGDRSLIDKISSICKMPDEYARILSGIVFKDDYASLSHKAISRILPFLKEGNTYDMACLLAGYRHSKNSLTKDEIERKVLKDRLDIIKKNSLRNPVVEKILNQMINVVNSAADAFGKPDEIHIELARSLKQTAKQREAASQSIAENTKENESITEILRREFGLSYVRKTDIVRYRLYQELKRNGYKTLYSNQYVPREILFSDEIDIEHIIPQALLFNDSYSNKTIEFKDINREKGRETARDFVESKYGAEEYRNFVLRVEDLYKNGSISRSKRANLLMAKTEIPEDFLERELTCSQYIAKYAKQLLESYVRTVIPTNGAITERLRREWQLVDVMKELNLPKYRASGKTFITQDKSGKNTEHIQDWTKRNDHRHHAMDALTIAFTTPAHIHCLNTLSARGETDTSIKLPAPMPLKELRAQFKSSIEATLVSIKAKNKVVTRNTNRTSSKNGIRETINLTPRGELHKEQVYGMRKVYDTSYISVGSKLTVEAAELISSPVQKQKVLDRLAAFGNDPKKAFKKQEVKDLFPDKIKCTRFKIVFSIRKGIDQSLSVDKVSDAKVRKILQSRLEQFDGKPAKAFVNLDDNPIWFDEGKKIPLKRVTITESFDLCAIHDKIDKDGNLILDKDGKPMPNDFVNLRNNHHVAIYRDSLGNLQENVVSFFEALNRIMNGLPAVDRHYRETEGWQFLFSMKINEMFVFPAPDDRFYPEEIDLMSQENYAVISRNLFRVQKLASSDYWFRHHLETVLNDDNSLKDKTWKRINSTKRLEGVVKVRINHIGRIVSVGEYD